MRKYDWPIDKLQMLQEAIKRPPVNYELISNQIGYPVWNVMKKANSLGYRNANKKFFWNADQVSYLLANWNDPEKNLEDIALYLKTTHAIVIGELKRRGLSIKKNRCWVDFKKNPEYGRFIVKNFKKMGNDEMAIKMRKKFPGPNFTLLAIRQFVKKNKLFRTKEELYNIDIRNHKRGCFIESHKKMWNKRKDKRKLGEIYIRKNKGYNYLVINTGKKIPETYSVWLWKKHKGKIPKGKRPTPIDGNHMNIVIENLELKDKVEGAKISVSGLSDSYIAGTLARDDKELKKLLLENGALLTLKRTQLIHKRNIKQHGTRAV